MKQKNARRKIITRSLSNNAGLGATIMFANADMSLADDGSILIPYGMWRHTMGWQKFGREEANAICNSFTSWLSRIMGRITGAKVGLPVFNGHPDQKEYESEFPDKTEYGQVESMEAKDDGLSVRMVLSNAGAELVKKGLRFISPRWDAHPVGEKEDATIWSPFRILSIGLVKRPNIPTASLVNHGSELMNKNDLIALFGLVATATDDDVKKAVEAAAKRPSAESLSNAESKLTAAERALAARETELALARTTLTNAESARDTANTALSNERKAHRAVLVNSAIREGRVLPADQAVWVGRLDSNFEVESKALANLKPVLKVEGITEKGQLVNLAAVNAALQAMTPEQRAEWAKTGILANDDGGDGLSGDDMANVGALVKLVNEEMNSAACQQIKDPQKRHSVAMRNVLAIHKKFLSPKGTDGTN